jgi:hypothetical protein
VFVEVKPAPTVSVNMLGNLSITVPEPPLPPGPPTEALPPPPPPLPVFKVPLGA